MKPYQHLNEEERFSIHPAVRKSQSRQAITLRLGRSSRMMKRNM